MWSNISENMPGMTEVPDQLYERLLVLRCKTGDEAAFEELVGRYQPRLRYYLRKMLGDIHEADDALQEVWFDVFRGLPRLAEPAAFAAWVYRIARTRVFRIRRGRRHVDRPLEESDLPNTQADEEFGPDEIEQIHATLGRLTPVHREVLVLRFVEGMSYQDIARVTGCSLGTVRSRIHYAKRELRAVMERARQHE